MNNQNEVRSALPEYFSREAELNNDPNQGRIEPPIYGYCDKSCMRAVVPNKNFRHN